MTRCFEVSSKRYIMTNAVSKTVYNRENDKSFDCRDRKIFDEVEIGDFVTIGGIVPIHQFTRIGDYVMIASVAKPFTDVVPYAICGGEGESRIVGINRVGLERHGFSSERRLNIKRAYKILFRENLALNEALLKLEQVFPGDIDIKRIIDFAKNSSRGIMRMKSDDFEVN